MKIPICLAFQPINIIRVTYTCFLLADHSNLWTKSLKVRLVVLSITISIMCYNKMVDFFIKDSYAIMDRTIIFNHHFLKVIKKEYHTCSYMLRLKSYRILEFLCNLVVLPNVIYQLLDIWVYYVNIYYLQSLNDTT